MPTLSSSPFKSLAMPGETVTSVGPPLPLKIIDLNSSTRSTDKETGHIVTRTAFVCDIVVERQNEGMFDVA